MAWRMQRQGRGLLVLEDDINMVLNVRDRIERLRQSARDVGAKLLMMAPGETFEENTVTCGVDERDCSIDDDGGVRVLREKMTLYTQVQRPSACNPSCADKSEAYDSCRVTAPQAYLLDDGAGKQLLQLLKGGVTCAIDWWLGLMWHGGHIDAAVRHLRWWGQGAAIAVKRFRGVQVTSLPQVAREAVIAQVSTCVEVRLRRGGVLIWGHRICRISSTAT
jgi:hypothetical protein